jgi:uncharacterized lipoprotein YbaY
MPGNVPGKTVSGQLTVPEALAVSSSTVAYVDLVDTSLADQPSVLIQRQVIPHVDKAIGPERKLKFEIAIASLDPSRSYEVRAHVSVDGSEAMSTGDSASMQSYPVLTFGNPATTDVATKVIE